jgi:Na+-translocating ferredoxin:NAD+ oxidoreductase RNF subunit RnfB
MNRKYSGRVVLPPDFVHDDPPIALVAESRCIACERCLPLCFFDALVMAERPEHPLRRVAIVIPTLCTGCGLCFEACPVDAFEWDSDARSPYQVDGEPR